MLCMFIQRSLVFLGVIITVVAKGQLQLSVPLNLQPAYANGTRTVNGEPGKQYWQNTANYNININFNPLTRLLNGTVDIEYVNNSPNTLQQIVFKLYPNLYKKGSVRMMPVLPPDITDGVH